MDMFSEGLCSFDTEEISQIPFQNLRCIILGDEKFLAAMKESNNFDYAVYLTSKAGILPGSLLSNALRMRPDCIILSDDYYRFASGEAEMAANTGHEVMIVTEV